MLVDARALLDAAATLPLALVGAPLEDGATLPLTIEITLELALGVALALALALAEGPVQNFWKNDCPSVTPVKSCCVVA